MKRWERSRSVWPNEVVLRLDVQGREAGGERKSWISRRSRGINGLAVARTGTLSAGGFGPQVDTRSRGRSPQVPGASLVERQLLRNGCEQFSHIRRRLGGGFEKEETGLARVRLSVCGRNSALIGTLGNKIELVACQRNHNVLISLTLELLHPGLGLVQRGLLQKTMVSERSGSWGAQVGRTAWVMS